MKAANETSFEPIGDLDLVLLSAEQIRTDPGIFNAMLRVVQADYVKPSFVFEREMKKASHAHVCIVGQRLVGFCLFEQGYLGGGLRCTYVGLTVISPEFRGRGLGKQLLRATVTRAGTSVWWLYTASPILASAMWDTGVTCSPNRQGIVLDDHQRSLDYVLNHRGHRAYADPEICFVLRSFTPVRYNSVQDTAIKSFRKHRGPDLLSQLSISESNGDRILLFGQNQQHLPTPLSSPETAYIQTRSFST